MDKDNIDRIFSKKLNEIEIKPRPEAWEKLSSKLSTAQKKGYAFYISIAASVLFLLSISIVYTIKIKHVEKIYASLNTSKIKKSSLQNKKINVEKFLTEKEKTADNVIVKSEKKNKNTSKIIKENENYNNKEENVEEITIVKNLEKQQEQESELDLLPIELIAPIASTKKVGKQSIILYQTELDIPTPHIKGKSKVGKILTQLKRFKKGEPVDLNELGIDKQTLLATLKEKFN